MPSLSAWSPRVLSVLRVLTALLFMEHGLMKLFAFPAAFLVVLILSVFLMGDGLREAFDPKKTRVRA